MEEIRAYKVGSRVFESKEAALRTMLDAELREIFREADANMMKRVMIEDSEKRKDLIKALQNFENEVE